MQGAACTLQRPDVGVIPPECAAAGSPFPNAAAIDTVQETCAPEHQRTETSP